MNNREKYPVKEKVPIFWGFAEIEIPICFRPFQGLKWNTPSWENCEERGNLSALRHEFVEEDEQEQDGWEKIVVLVLPTDKDPENETVQIVEAIKIVN